jgi:hypothetical protein
MTVTITDKTVDPLLLADGQSVTTFKGITVTDTAALSNTETVSITLSQSESQTLGVNYNYYPAATNLGSISDPNGGGTWNAATETFTESGVIGGDPTFATTLLSRLVYNAPTLPNGQSFAVQASVSVVDNGVTTTDQTPISIADIAPPAISGTVANEPIASDDKIAPFATVTITEPNFNYDYYTITAGNPNNTYTQGASYYYNPKESATITITDGGKATDADGLLTGPGISKTGVGTYSIGSDYVYNIQNELRTLSFQTITLAAGQTSNPMFELDVTDTTTNETSKDTTTSLLVIGPTLTPMAPKIAGTLAGQTVAPANVLDPFASVTISDTNPSPKDSATITLTNASGTATDANGTLTGTGLTETASGSGVYTLAVTDPATLTSELAALTFHPTGLPNGVTSETTGFTLAVSDPLYISPATDNKTTVIETASNSGQTSGNFQVNDETTGQSSFNNGEAYSGPVSGLTNDIILVTSDNVNVTAQIPNVFIKTGSGEDAIDVSKANGNNILDGSTGSNFLTGGTGNDTFYLDDRNATQPIWSTIVNFHSGDNATIWGITQADFTLNWVDNEGASNAKGLTGTLNGAGTSTCEITLAGLTTANLSDGTLSISYGKTADMPNLPGSYYMLIHAN